MQEKGRYVLILLVFPSFFIIHGINENFGLVPLPVIGKLFIKYSLYTIIATVLSQFLLRDAKKGFVFSFLLLCCYFFFGAAKDTLTAAGYKNILSYKYMIPVLLLVFTGMFYLIKKSNKTFRRPVFFITVLLLIFLFFDSAQLVVNIIRKNEIKQDFGDQTNALYHTARIDTAATKPSVFWIVFDEYSSSNVLQKVWNYKNPLDSVLRERGFYIADSASSNYNFTHYSLTSTLDMVYLPELKYHTSVTARELVRGNYSLYENNVTKLFEHNGYRIENYTIYNLQHYPTKGILHFEHTPEALINHQTLFSRVRKDIGWNFPAVLKRNRKKADSLFNRNAVDKLDSTYHAFYNTTTAAIRSSAKEQEPFFFMIHIYLPHEPFIYNEDGSKHYVDGLSASGTHYLPQLKYTNRIVQMMIDSIQHNYKNKELVILLQGDHGFKFEENDPLFDKESCKIMYAVYNSRKKYASWYPSVSSVNGFRILFNDNFGTTFPLLPDSSFILLSR